MSNENSSIDININIFYTFGSRFE